jgi:hypothetical protein
VRLLARVPFHVDVSVTRLRKGLVADFAFVGPLLQMHPAYVDSQMFGSFESTPTFVADVLSIFHVGFHM